jgi:glycosyltransferase involved in cell wall biosynthesis
LTALGQQSLPTKYFEVIVVDDGSRDDTETFCRNFKAAYSYQYFRQENAGAGAARRFGAKQARGEYLLLFNDDTIATPDLLAQHLGVHQQRRREKIAVLGDFRYPPAAVERALTYYLARRPFLFPQVNMPAGVQSKNAYFVSCNLSLRRDCVLEAGSFDSRFRVAEDTELGVRLRLRGTEVFYHPAALAYHEHLNFTIGDLIRRAKIYGHTQLGLLRKHPHLLGSGTGPFGKMDEQTMQRMRGLVHERRKKVADAVVALEQFDSIDFLPFFARNDGQRTAADAVMEVFEAAVPEIFWFYIYESLLQACENEPRLASPLIPAVAQGPVHAQS